MHALSLPSNPRSKTASSRAQWPSCSRIRIAQMSFSFQGVFWPTIFPLFQRILVGGIGCSVHNKLPKVEGRTTVDRLCKLSIRADFGNGSKPTSEIDVSVPIADLRLALLKCCSAAVAGYWRKSALWLQIHFQPQAINGVRQEPRCQQKRLRGHLWSRVSKPWRTFRSNGLESTQN